MRGSVLGTRLPSPRLGSPAGAGRAAGVAAPRGGAVLPLAPRRRALRLSGPPPRAGAPPPSPPWPGRVSSPALRRALPAAPPPPAGRQLFPRGCPRQTLV